VEEADRLLSRPLRPEPLIALRPFTLSGKDTQMTQEITFDVRASTSAIIAHYRSRSQGDDDVAAELRNVLTLLPRIVPVQCGDIHGDPSHGVTRFVEEALAPKAGTIADVIGALRPIAAILPWRFSYSPRADLPGLENRMAWAEFVGPEAPIHSDKVCLGVTLIGPHTLYPAHFHPAVESYFVLSGTALWTAAGISRSLPPGSFILHPGNVVHAMETFEAPLLAAYTWTGDIETLSIYG
jgi:mannose-6-phosphate isomerase-like protein (cupin superfamily)